MNTKKRSKQLAQGADKLVNQNQDELAKALDNIKGGWYGKYDHLGGQLIDELMKETNCTSTTARQHIKLAITRKFGHGWGKIKQITDTPKH